MSTSPDGVPRRRGSGLLQLLGRETRALVAPHRVLAAQYRRAAGDGASPEQEQRYVTGRRKVACWILGWTLLVPLLLTVALHFLFPDYRTLWAVARSLIILLVLMQLGLRVQTRLLPLLHRWVGTSASPR